MIDYLPDDEQVPTEEEWREAERQIALDSVRQVQLDHARAEDWLPRVESGSVHLVWIDPPYMNILAEKWDRQWPTVDAYLEWLGSILDEIRRVLAPAGSLYVCQGPALAARVEVEVVRPRFQVLNSITWPKPDSVNRRAEREAQRAYLCQSERIIFAEQHGADETAMDASGYTSSCERLKREIFGDYLAAEVD